jgi:hypothetical protein
VLRNGSSWARRPNSREPRGKTREEAEIGRFESSAEVRGGGSCLRETQSANRLRR